MNIKELQKRLQEYGIVGAGGAGFPTYMKLDERANTILLNCAECEPLLKLHRQLLKEYAKEILETFSVLAEVLKAEEGIIGIKKEYKETIQALLEFIEDYPTLRIHELDSAYPMGDEQVLIYEATGKVLRPGGIPIEAGIAVFNVETVYNIYQALEKDHPVTDKVISVVAEVENPVTVRVPVGCTLDEVVALAGRKTTEDAVYFVGGPMMGMIKKGDDVVTKTTNAILVLPKDHYLLQRKNSNSSIDLKRAASICCQCEVCTDLCPRHMLGHPIAPHMFMRAASNQDFQNIHTFMDTMYCCSCGICELYACPQSLSPRTLITEYKTGLMAAGIRPNRDTVPTKVNPARTFRKVPEKRLEARLGLSDYNKEAPLNNQLVLMKRVQILLRQHIGAPAKALVEKGDRVKRGQMIGAPGEGLSVGIHASIDGTVTQVSDSYVVIDGR